MNTLFIGYNSCPGCVVHGSMASKRKSSAAISQFSEDIRGFSQQIGDSLNLLKRIIDHGPSSGVHEFKDALSEVEEEVAEISSELEQLEQHTTQAISFEELLGHCLGLYHSNRQGVMQLEQHLRQYGYTPEQELQQPVDPVAMQPTGASGVQAGSDSDDLACDTSEADCDQQPHALRTVGKGRAVSHIAPHTPHYAMSHEAKARLQQRVKTPGMPLRFQHDDDDDDDEEEEEGYDDDDVLLARLGKAATASVPDVRPDQLASNKAGPAVHGVRRSAAGTTTTPGAARTAGATVPPTTGRGPPPAAPSPASSDSLTPEGLLLSPSFAALQAKYGAAETQGPTAATTTPATSLLSSPHQAGLSFGRLTLVEEHLCDGTPVAALPQSRAPPQAQAQPQVEEDTCSLYQLLIKSKEVPASLVAANSRAAAQQAAQPREAAASKRSQSVHVCTPSRQVAAAGCGPSPSPARYSRSRSALRGAEADAARASAAQALECRLASLEHEWVASGQAALTPRRAAAAAAGSGGTTQGVAPSPRLTKFQDLPAAQCHPPTSFAFNLQGNIATAGSQQSTSQALASMFNPGAAPQAAHAAAPPGTSLSTTTATPALEHDVLSRYLSSSSTGPTTADLLSGRTPALQLTGAGTTQLSPGTASLLTRVYGATGVPASSVPPQHATDAGPSTTSNKTDLPTSHPAAAALAPSKTCSAAGGVPPGCQVAPTPSTSSGARLVCDDEFSSLPRFLSSQISLAQLNTALVQLSHQPGAYSAEGFSLVVLEQLGLSAQATKALHSCLVKLQRAVMHGSARLRLC